MAEITCCTGQTECNHLITIGYLKSFIGTNIKDSGGNTVNVNTTKSDSYVPTYAELTGGTLVPQFVDGGSNKWHSNIDGITINGTYSENQGVEQNDLVLTYTRFKSLSISAGKTSFDECEDSTTITATYKLTKTIKAMNSCVAAESSSEGSDTACNMSFSSSQTWLTLGTCFDNTVTASAGKNGTWSADTRNGVISASVTYKGQTYSSNSITITQDELTGSYSVYEGRHYTATTITSHDELTQNTCSSTTVNASATAYFYDRYKWKDSCGLVYEYNYKDVYDEEPAGSASHTFDEVLCPTTAQTDSYVMTITYQGNSDSVTFYQVCSQSCATCENYNTYGECTDNTKSATTACQEDITVFCDVPTRIHHMGWVNGECVETGHTDTSYRQTAVVTIPDNDTQSAKTYNGSVTTLEGGVINYTIWQPAGPCGGCGEATTTYLFSDVSVSCSAHTNEQISVPYTATTTYSVAACSADTGSGISSFTINITECNETTSVKNYTFGGSLGSFIVHQAAGNGACCCSCNDFTLSSSSLSWPWDSTTAKSNSYTMGNCITDVTASTGNNWFSVSVSNNSINVTPSGNNTTTTVKTDTITVSYKAHGNDCPVSKTFTVEQNPYGCSCSDLVLSTTPSQWAWNETAAKTATYTLNTECITVTSVDVSGDTWFSVSNSVNGSNGTVTVTPSGNNTSNNAKVATVTIRYTSNGVSCQSAFTVTQMSNTCVCDDSLTIVTTPSQWAWNETAAKTGTYTISSQCVRSIDSVISSNNWFSVSNSLVGTNGTVTVTPSGNNTSDSTKESTIRIDYTLVNGETCSGKTFTVTQGINTCDCTVDLTIGTTPSAWAWNETSAKTATYSFNSTCIAITGVTSSNNWFSVSNSVNGSNGTVTVTPSGNNNSKYAKVATITVNGILSNGEPCDKSFEVKQNAYVCTPSSCTCYLVSNATANTVSSAATSATVTWQYTAVTWTTASTCEMSSAYTTGSTSTAVTFAAATCNDYNKSGSFTWGGHNACTSSSACTSSDVTVNWTVPQTRPDGCDCTCDSIVLSTNSVSFAYDDTGVTSSVTLTCESCNEPITDTIPSTYFNIVKNSTGRNTYEYLITPKGINTTQSPYTETITISGKPGDCTKTITITQAPQVIPTCNCTNLTFTKKS